MGGIELVEEARRDRRLPHAADAAVGGEVDLRAPARAGDADIGEAALLLEAGAAVLVERALVREQPLLPARQIDRVEFEPLGGVQRHDRHPLRPVVLRRVHDERDVLEERLQIRELLHGAHELLEVFKPPRGVGRAVGLPHGGVAGFVEHDLGELVVLHRLAEGGPAVEVAEQGTQRLPRLRLELLGLDHHPRGLRHRHAGEAAVVVKRADRRVAEAALRRVDDALEGEVVAGLSDAAQIGERVADFGALVEARAADHLVGHAERDEALLELAHLERRAHEDRHLVRAFALALLRLDVLADDARLLLRIPHAADGRLDALLAVGEKRLAEPVLVVGDEMRGGGEDVPRRAVVALEPHDGRAGKVLLEAQDVLDVGAAPAVDRLVVVADAADVVPPLRDQPQPEILHGVGVLVLVDEHVFEALVVLAQHVGIVAEQPQAFEQEVAEVDRVEDLQPLLIELVERGALAVAEGGGLARRHMRDIEAAVLPGVDQEGERARGPALVVDVLGLQHLLQQADLVVGVEDGEVRPQAHELGVAAQDFRADRMERAEPRHAFAGLPRDAGDAVLHLAGRLVGEGDREDFVRAREPEREDVRDARRQHARLAGARPREHQHRPLGGLHRGALFGVEALEIARRARHPGARARGDAAGRGNMRRQVVLKGCAPLLRGNCQGLAPVRRIAAPMWSRRGRMSIRGRGRIKTCARRARIRRRRKSG